MKRFIVVGCRRSGTMFTSQLLSLLRIRCGHECHFGAYTRAEDMYRKNTQLESLGQAGDVSWLAAPYVDILREQGWVVLHQVRNPISVLKSCLGGRFFHEDMWAHGHVMHTYTHLPQLSHLDVPLITAMKYWLYWNCLCASADEHYRVEDLSDYSTGVLQHILSLLAEERSDEECQKVLGALGTAVNHSHKVDQTVTWATLPEGPLKDETLTVAQEYGYSLAELQKI